MKTHALRLFVSLPLRTMCDLHQSDDYVAGPQEVEKIDCVPCLRELAKHGHKLTLLVREKGVAGIQQVALDEIESLGREAENTAERSDYREGCRSGVRAWTMLKDLLAEVARG